MSQDELIYRAIQIFHREKVGLPKPGNVIAHFSDKYAYEVRTVVQGKVTAFRIDENGQEVVKEFPAAEVFNPATVQKIALRLRSQEMN